MQTLLTQRKGVSAPGPIAELLNLMVGRYTDELGHGENNKALIPTIPALAEKRRMILKGTCDPFGATIALGENALDMGVSLATVQAPHLQANAHFAVHARRRVGTPSRPLYLHIEGETRVQQKLDRLEHRVLRDENDVGVLREVVRLSEVQIAETQGLRDAAMERIALLMQPLPVAVRWSARA